MKPYTGKPATLGSTAAAGVRLNPWKNLLISGNALFKLDDGGLRAKVVPLISVSYTFGK